MRSARKFTNTQPGVYYVSSRLAANRPDFDDSQRMLLMESCQSYAESCGLRILGIAVSTRHLDLLLRFQPNPKAAPPHGDLSEMMKRIKQNFSYTCPGDGSAWADRFKLIPVADKSETLQEVYAYVSSRPIVDGASLVASHYRFASFGLACLGDVDWRAEIMGIFPGDEWDRSRALCEAAMAIARPSRQRLPACWGELEQNSEELARVQAARRQFPKFADDSVFLKRLREQTVRYGEIGNDRELRAWVTAKRRADRRGTLAPELKAQMSELGVPFGLPSGRASKHGDDATFLKRLEAHLAEGGKVNQDKALASWIRAKRRLDCLGRLAPELKARLRSLGYLRRNRVKAQTRG
jgi:hypothetical protein